MGHVAEALRTLFEGAEGVYGTYAIDPSTLGNGKVGGKALTVKKAVTSELWEAHVDGKQSIGIVPVRADNTCVWGCIDVDQYPPPTGLLKKIKEKKTPVHVCLSKSGGYHLFVFSIRPVPAKMMQQALRNMAADLGLTGCEIFPKQTAIDAARGEIGNWLNMPYFGNSRLGLALNGKPVPAELFINTIEKIDPTGWSRNHHPKLNESIVPDGPPCLQAITSETITAQSHNRNNVIMAMAAFYRRAYPDDWEVKLANFNSNQLKPPLPASEIDGIRKRCRDKDYTYQCSQDPLRGYCNRPVCLTRKYGIQGGQGEMVIDSVTQIKAGKESLWLIRMNGVGLLELDTQALLSQARFAEQYFNTFRTMPASMKPEDWKKFVSMIGEQAMIIEDVGFSEEVRFKALLERFIQKKSRPEKEAVLRDGVWVDEHQVAWFTGLSLAKFLDLNRFTAFKPGALNHAVKEAGGEFTVLRVGTTTHRMIRMAVPRQEETAVPDIEPEAI